MLIVGGGTASGQVDGSALQASFPYRASQVEIRQVLSELTRRTGIPTQLADGVRGSVSIGGDGGTIATLLDTAAAQTGSVWWYDGVMLHVEPNASLTTALVDSRGLTVRQIRSELAALALEDPRFPLRSTADGAILRVSGPKGYVEQVVRLIETLNVLRRPEGTGDTLGLYVPPVYYGRPSN